MPFQSDALKVARRGRIYVAPFGTTLPTDIATALNAAFVNVGHTGDDPVTFNPGRTLEAKRSWQRSTPTIYIPGDEDPTVKANLLEWKTATIIAAFGGGEIVDTATGTRYNPPTDDIYEMSIVVAWRTLKAGVNCRAVVQRAVSMVSPEVALSRKELTSLPVTFAAMSVDLEDDEAEESAPWYFLTDSVDWDAGSEVGS